MSSFRLFKLAGDHAIAYERIVGWAPKLFALYFVPLCASYYLKTWEAEYHSHGDHDDHTEESMSRLAATSDTSKVLLFPDHATYKDMERIVRERKQTEAAEGRQ